MTISNDINPKTLTASNVIGTDGAKLGEVTGVYLDNHTDKPRRSAFPHRCDRRRPGPMTSLAGRRDVPELINARHGARAAESSAQSWVERGQPRSDPDGDDTRFSKGVRRVVPGVAARAG